MADITTLQNLKDAAAGTLVGGPDYTIAPGTYTLDAVVSFGNDVSITHDNTAGNVIIDGDDLYKLVIRPGFSSGLGDISWIGLSDTQRIIFTKAGPAGDNACADVRTPARFAQFDYCDFTECLAFNGLNLAIGAMANPLTVICNNCRAINNDLDGFSIDSDSGTTHRIALYLNDCEGTGSDPLGSGGGAGDGVTGHLPNHWIYIDGGKYYANGKTGIAASGGTNLIMTGGVEVYGNQLTVVGFGQVNAGSSYVSMSNVKLSAGGVDQKLLGVNGGQLYLNDCEFDGTGLTNNLIDLEGTAALLTASLNGCVIHDGAGTNKYQLNLNDSDVKAQIANCTFGGGTRHIQASLTDYLTVYNSILTGASSFSINAATDKYSNNIANDYNDFFGNVGGNFSGDSVGLNDNDLTVDPQLDADYKPQNPEVKTGGKPDVNDNPTSIGAIGATATAGGYRSRYSG